MLYGGGFAEVEQQRSSSARGRTAYCDKATERPATDQSIEIGKAARYPEASRSISSRDYFNLV